MTSISTIVFDSNSIGPNLRLGLLGDVVATAKANGIRVCVPEVVVWELAEHDHKAYVESLSRYRKGATRAINLGLPAPVPVTFSVDDFVSAITAALTAHPEIEIVPFDGDSAMRAVRDQVLQTGAGSLKQDTKTGAADSGWLRSIVRSNGGTFDRLMLVTGDKKAVEQICLTEGWTKPQMAPDFNAARLVAGWRRGASAALVAKVHEWIEELMPLEPGAKDVAYDSFEIGLENFWLWEASGDSYWDELFSVDTLTEIEAASISEDGTEFSATMTFEARVAYLMVDADREGDMVPRLVEEDAAIVYADVKVALDADQKITGVRFSG
jgi:hypothetical protein